MRVVEIRDDVVPIRSDLRNAVIDFSEMTVSVVAVVTDVVRDGVPLVGFGFNSNGRYAQSGILRERMIPPLLGTDAHELLDPERDNFDPFSAWRIAMRNEKPGGHGERSVALGVLDMAFWDLAAKVEEKPLARLLAERFGSAEPDRTPSVLSAASETTSTWKTAGWGSRTRRGGDRGEGGPPRRLPATPGGVTVGGQLRSR